MQLLEVSIYAWILRIVGIIGSTIVVPTIADDVTKYFQGFYELSKRQHLNNAQEKELVASFRAIPIAILKMSDVVCTTPVQIDSLIFDSLTFDNVIIDKAGVVTESELLLAWRHNEMVRGQMDLTNEMFYDDKMVYGPNTLLTKRPEAARLGDYIRAVYPEARDSPAGSNYPILLNVEGTCHKEDFGTSYFNQSNVSVIVNRIIHIACGLELSQGTRDIGIVTPYHAQVRALKLGFRQAAMGNKDLDFSQLDIGTVEHWQDEQRPIICFNLV
ncbi:MAG: hypothetical protein Q9213_004830 [Squamulea squamosa]